MSKQNPMQKGERKMKNLVLNILAVTALVSAFALPQVQALFDKSWSLPDVEKIK